ncbi:aldehyde dehydrogenase family protein [Sinorhizobium meliloti]|uniref:aldehyde dehydrogenase family protein n=1 Tax=Rhizobium meliloti TaxID=382 RepID=UPI001F344EA1
MVGGEGRPEGSNKAGSFVQLSSLASATTCASPARRSSVRCSASLLVATRKKRSRSPTTHYGPQANVFSSDLEPAQRANDRIEAGRVIINGAPHEPLAPFGGFKQSGFGREFGVFGFEAFLEPRQSILDRSFHYS